MKKTVSLLLSAIILCTLLLSACDRFGNGKKAEPTVAPTAAVTEAQTTAPTKAPAAPTQTPTQAPPTDPPAPTDPPGPSATYTAIRNCLADNADANGYTIARIIGSDNDQLILSFGVSEAEKVYEVYTILNNGIEFQGKLSASHTIPYIDRDTGTFGCFSGHMSAYAYGPATLVGGLHIDVQESGTIEPGEQYPEVPGSKIEFDAINNLAPIDPYY